MPLKISWFATPGIVVVGQASGDWPNDLFSQTVTTASSDAQFEALSSGACDLAVTAMDNVIGWNSRGGSDDFIILAQVERTTPLQIFARPGIASLADLEGARVLVDSAENGFVVVLRALLFDAGLGLDAYRLIPAGGVKERFEALGAGQGDATLLGPPFSLMASRAGLQILADVQQNYPAFPGQGIVTRRSILARKGKDMTQLLRLMRDTLSAILDDHDAAKAALTGTGAPGPIADLYLSIMPDMLVPDRCGMELLVAQRRGLGLPGGEVDLEKLVVWDFASGMNS